MGTQPRSSSKARRRKEARGLGFLEGFKICGEGGLRREEQGPRKKAGNNRTDTEAQGTFGGSASPYFKEVEGPERHNYNGNSG